MMGCVWHEVTLEQLIGKPMASLLSSPSQEPLHRQGVGGTAWSQEEGSVSEQPTLGLQMMHSLSSLFLTWFICLLLLNVAWDRFQYFPGTPIRDRRAGITRLHLAGGGE